MSTGKANSGGSTDKPPFIPDQRWALLQLAAGYQDHATRQEALQQVEQRVRHGERGPGLKDSQQRFEWIDVSRQQRSNFLSRLLPGADLQYVCVVDAAGMGKTTTSEWLKAVLGKDQFGLIPIWLEASKFTNVSWTDQNHLTDLLFGMVAAEAANSLPSHVFTAQMAKDIHDDLGHALRRGQLVLIIDALDQATGSLSPLLELLKSERWSNCRVIITGRAYAVRARYTEVFEPFDYWHFIRLDHFTGDQQEKFLTRPDEPESRYRGLTQQVKSVLGVPRMLKYLRRIRREELAGLKTAADVMQVAILDMIKECLSVGGSGGRFVVSEEGQPTQSVPNPANVDLLWRSLATVAFVKTAMQLQSIDPQTGNPTPPHPNLDVIQRDEMPEFRRQVWMIMEPHLRGAENATEYTVFEKLAQLNSFLEGDLLHSELELPTLGMSLDEQPALSFTNLTLQEFFSAFYLAHYARPGDLETVWDQNWLVCPARRESEVYREIWQYLCDMPLKETNRGNWLHAISLLYRPGNWRNPTTRGHESLLSELMVKESAVAVRESRRSCAFMYRSWDRLESFGRPGAGKTGRISQEDFAVHRLAKSILDTWRGEFQALCDQGHSVALSLRFDAERDQPDPELGNQTSDGQYRRCPPVGDLHTFHIGSPDGKQPRDPLIPKRAEWPNEAERSTSEGLHRVTVTPFWLRKFVVTNAEYELFDGNHLSERDPKVNPDDALPVINVSWWEAVMFCRWLGPEYWLPTEAQWEAACRAGTESPFSFGTELNGTQANCDGNYPYGTEKKGPYLNQTSPLGKYPPNGWGMYDMNGNVWEWCQDWYGAYDESTPDADPLGPLAGSYRVIRGGSWIYYAQGCRAASRNGGTPENRDDFLGFRLAAVPAGAKSAEPNAVRPSR